VRPCGLPGAKLVWVASPCYDVNDYELVSDTGNVTSKKMPGDDGSTNSRLIGLSIDFEVANLHPGGCCEYRQSMDAMKHDRKILSSKNYKRRVQNILHRKI